jgi:hypothetical protein
MLLIPKYNEKDYEYIKELGYKCFVSKNNFGNASHFLVEIRRANFNFELSEIDKILCLLINKYSFSLGGNSIKNYKEFLNNLILFTEEYVQNKYLDSKNKLTSKYFSRCYKKPYSEKMCENVKYGEWFYVNTFEKIINDEFICKFFLIFDYSEFVFSDSEKVYNEPIILGDKIVKSIEKLGFDYFAS